MGAGVAPLAVSWLDMVAEAKWRRDRHRCDEKILLDGFLDPLIIQIISGSCFCREIGAWAQLKAAEQKRMYALNKTTARFLT